MDECTYSPQITPGNPMTGMPETIPVTLVNRDTILLEYPYNSPTLTLELKNPILGDHDVAEYSRIQRHTRGLGLKLYRDPTWPKSRTFNISFQGLSSTDRNAILAFIRQTAGLELKYTDYYSQVHKVIMLQPKTPITQTGQGCQYTWKTDLQEVIT